MKNHFVRKASTLPLIALVLIGLLSLPSAHASTLVTFTTGDIEVTTVLGRAVTAKLDLRVSVSTSSSMVSSGSSGSMGVDVFGEYATISVTYAGITYSSDFTTPIGSLNISLGPVYAKVAGSVRARPQVKGDASISPTTISWTSNGSQSISVAHKGSMFSSDTITVELPFEYVPSIAIGIEDVGEFSVNVASLNGTPTVTQDLSTIPIATIVIVVVVVVAAILGFVVVKRRKPSPKPSLQQTTRP